tara:strand:+ start:90510 stop:90692 length:183 start_codon:yes stop_codon:yes gene_type:complete
MKKLEKLKSNKLDLSMQKSVKGGLPIYVPIQMVTHVIDSGKIGPQNASDEGNPGYYDTMD